MEHFDPRLPSVLVVDDETEFHNLVRRIANGITNIVSATCVSDATTKLRARKYIAVILDLVLHTKHGREDGMTLVPEVVRTQPGVPILIATGRPDLEWVSLVAENVVASGLPRIVPWPKSGDLSPILHFILGAMRLPAPTVDEAVCRLKKRGPTDRHADIIGCKISGLSDAEAGTKLGISAATVRVHLREARDRMGVHSMAGIVAAVIAELAPTQF